MRLCDWRPEELLALKTWHAEGVSVEEIARRLGRTLGAVYKKRQAQRLVKHRGSNIPAEHRGWYEKLRREISRDAARAELERVLAS